MTRAKTIQDMKDNLFRLQTLEADAKMFCSYRTFCYISDAVYKLKVAIKIEESK